MSLQKSDNTAGGLAKLYIVRLLHFKGLMWSNDYQCFLLKDDTYNYLEELYFTQDTGAFKVKRKKGTYTITIEASIPGTDDLLDELENTPFLVLGLTYNKQFLLFGDANNYFIYDYNQDSGADFAELNNTAFSLKRQMMFKPKLIRDPFIVNNDPIGLPFDVFANSVNFTEESEGLYRKTYPYIIDPSANVHAIICNVGPCNFQNKAILTFEMNQYFASGNFAPVSGFAKVIDPETLMTISNHHARNNVSYSSEQANTWVTVTMEIWSDSPPFNALEVYIATRDVGVTLNEYVQMRNFTVQTLP